MGAAAVRRGPLMAMLDGPYNRRARREVATRLFGTPELPAGTSAWRAYYYPDYDFQGDYDLWFRLDEVTDTEVAQIVARAAAAREASERLIGRPTPIDLDCEGDFARHPGPARWWPEGVSGLRRIDSEGVLGVYGHCLWIDDRENRLFLHDWKV